MNFPVYQVGGGFMPSQNFISQPVAAHLPAGYYPPNAWHAINALTPGLFRAASEQRAIFGSTYEAILVNLFGPVSFGVAGNFRIRGHNGKAMPLTLHLRFVGRTLSGKTDAYDRFNAPIIEAMKGWKKSWRFANVTPPTLLRKIRGGSILSMLGMAEGRGHLSNQIGGQLSRAFQELNDLYDAHVPAFDRADDDDNDEVVANAPHSAIFVTCVNVQNDANLAWFDKHAQDAIGSGYQYRLLILETDQTVAEGAGARQPESALLDYDQRMVELIASARLNAEAISAGKLPMIEISPEAEQILRQALAHFQYMASVTMSPNDARVFAVRLSANMRRMAGCMHVYERYQGAVSGDTMARAATIAECFGAHWLAIVFPPKPVSAAEQRGQYLLKYLCYCLRQAEGEISSWRESDILAQAANFGWSRAEMKAALMWVCGNSFAWVQTRTESSRRVIKVELNLNHPLFQPVNRIDIPKYR